MNVIASLWTNLVAAGIADIAEKEACRMEHAISEESFEKLKKNGK